MSQVLTITYGSLVLGLGQANSDYNLTGKYSFQHDYDRFSLEFEVVVSNATRATFLASEAALLAAFREPDLTLVVKLSATTRHTFSPTANTGFNIRASARRAPGQDTTPNSCRYVCTVSGELPATKTGRAGRRGGSVDVSTSPAGRRTCVITGTYTALSNKAARTQFEAEVDDFCDDILTDLGGTWELVDTPNARADDENKVITFVRRYEEIKRTQAAGVLDHPALVQPRLTFDRVKTSPESTTALGTVAPLVELVARFTASVKFASAAELEDVDTLIEEVVRPHVLAEAERVAGGGTVVVMREAPSFDREENVVSLTVAMVVDTGATFLRASVEVNDSIDRGVILKPMWSGDPYARDEYQGMASHVRVLTRKSIRVGSSDVIRDGVIASNHDGPAPLFDGFRFVRSNQRVRSWFGGVDQTLPLRSNEETFVYVKVNPAPTGGGSGSSGVADDKGDLADLLGSDLDPTGLGTGTGTFLTEL